MSEVATCALCRGVEDPRPNRAGGLDLCRRCYDGGAVAAAHARGFGLGVKLSAIGTDDPIFMVDGAASVPKPLFNASFRRKGPLSLLAALFGMTIRVQDPLFHELGVIVTRDKDRTRRFIDGDGPQSAVMDLLGEDVKVTVKQNGQLRVSGARKHDPFDQSAIERELAVLLVHLDDYASA